MLEYTSNCCSQAVAPALDASVPYTGGSWLGLSSWLLDLVQAQARGFGSGLGLGLAHPTPT